MIVDNFPDRTIIIDGKEQLYFGGTSYLGMATNKEFKDVLAKNITKWGTSYGSSRNANIKLSIYDKFENYFANYTETERSLVVSSGTLAGSLVIEHLSENFDAFYHYPKTHPAILARNSQPLLKDNELHPNIKNSEVKEIVITVDAILGGEVLTTNFDFLGEIPKNIKVTLVIDESHTLGLVGSNGNGISPIINHPIVSRKIMVSSLGKALGLASGIIASDKEFINELKQRATFVSSSGASPAYLAAYLASEAIYEEQCKKLRTNLVYVEKQLKQDTRFKFNVNYPVIYIESDTIFTDLLAKNIVITSFKYPTYKKRMNRIVITSNHTEQDLSTLIKILNGNK